MENIVDQVAANKMKGAENILKIINTRNIDKVRGTESFFEQKEEKSRHAIRAYLDRFGGPERLLIKRGRSLIMIPMCQGYLADFIKFIDVDQQGYHLVFLVQVEINGQLLVVPVNIFNLFYDPDTVARTIMYLADFCPKSMLAMAGMEISALLDLHFRNVNNPGLTSKFHMSNEEEA